MVRPILISLLWFLFTGAPLRLLGSDAGERPRVIHYSKGEYQANNQNWGAAQAPNGFLYFANTAGLLEFDGSRWTLYPMPKGQIVRSVACDREGRIFTGAFDEFGYWEAGENGRLNYHSLSRELAENTRREEIWQILPLPGRVLFQSFSTFYEYNYRQVQEIRPPGNILFLQEVNGRVLVPVIGSGLYEWRGGEDFQFIRGSEILAGVRVRGILPHPEGLLVATEQSGLLIYDGRQFRAWVNEADPLLRKFQLNRIRRLPNGSLALGTILNGLYILDREGRIRYHLNKENGLQNNTVLSLLPDSAGDLWIGLDKGIDLVALGDPLVFFQDKNGILGAVYSAAIFQGRLYLGTNQGVYVRRWKNPGADSFRLLPGTQGQVWDLYPSGQELLCGHNDGTFSIVNQEVRKISDITGGWTMIPAPANPRKLIQGTYTGLVLFEKEEASGRWSKGKRIPEFIEPLKQLAFDQDGSLWGVHAYQGLYRFQLSPDLDSILHIQQLGPKEGLSGDYSLRLQVIDGRVLVRSDTCWLSWNRRQNRLETWAPTSAPPDAGTPALLLSGLDGEWFAVYPDHLSWMNRSQLLATLPLSLVGGYERIITLDPSTYLFCLEEGYALLDRWQPFPSRPIPQAILRWVEARGKNGEFRQIASGGSSPDLPHRLNNLRFFFGQPYFAKPLLFRYRLLGFQPEWSAWSPTAEREYTNLPPGEYRFELCSNIQDQITSFSFQILPPWYNTSWARLAFALLLLALLALLVRWHHYRLDRQRRQMEIERERLLQQQRIRSRNEQLQLDIINKSKELANSTFNLIRKNEILLQLKEDLHAMKNSPGSHLPDKYYQHLTHLIDRHLSNEQDWQLFEVNFNQVHEAFFKSLLQQFPDLTPGDLKLAAYLKMNLSSKEIAPLLNISVRGVENKRYRLRRKLQLPADANLTEFFLNF